MRTLSVLFFFCGLSAAFVPLRAAEPVVFTRDVAPILVRHCQACHGPRKAKGGYRVDTFYLLGKTGKSGLDALSPGKPDDSELYALLTLESPHDRMPLDADPLPADQIELIRRWIAEGARFDADDVHAALSTLLPPVVHEPAPEHYRSPQPLTALAFTGDENVLAVAGYREVTFWNTLDGRLVRRIGNLPPRIESLRFSPDRRMLAVAGGLSGQMGEVRLVGMEEGGILKVLGPYDDLALDVRFSDDGSLLAVATADRRVELFELPDFKLRFSLTDHADAVTGLAFSRDGKKLATSSRDKTARVFRTEDGKSLTVFRKHDQPALAVTFVPGDEKLISSDTAGSLHVWRIREENNAIREVKAPAAILRLETLAGLVYATCADGAVRVYEPTDALPMKRQITDLGGWIMGLASDPATGRIACGNDAGLAWVWKTTDEKPANPILAMPGPGK